MAEKLVRLTLLTRGKGEQSDVARLSRQRPGAAGCAGDDLPVGTDGNVPELLLLQQDQNLSILGELQRQVTELRERDCHRTPSDAPCWPEPRMRSYRLTKEGSNWKGHDCDSEKPGASRILNVLSGKVPFMIYTC